MIEIVFSKLFLDSQNKLLFSKSQKAESNCLIIIIYAVNQTYWSSFWK